MGNTGACGLFDGDRKGQDQFWIDGLTEKENLTIKELYKKMDISGNWYHFICRQVHDHQGVPLENEYPFLEVEKAEANHTKYRIVARYRRAHPL